MLQVHEAGLAACEQQSESRAGVGCGGQQHLDAIPAVPEHVIDTEDTADSPFRIKRKEKRGKRGPLGFRPLLRTSAKPSSSAAGRTDDAYTALSETPGGHASANALPAEQLATAKPLPAEKHLSPSAFRTPAPTRSLPHAQADTQLPSGMYLVPNARLP